MKSICFIISLPRSGSTLLQRILSSSPAVKTSAESWLLPPLMNIRYNNSPLAEFAYDHARIAIEDLIERIPDGETVWNNSIREFVVQVLSAEAEADQVLLEKTPRNALFVDQILKTFPDSQFIFLFRNPASIVHSINETWGGGHWKAHHYEIDLITGLNNLACASETYFEDPRILRISYEDLVADPANISKQVFDHIGIPFDPSYLESLPMISGAMGDKTGQARYGRIATQSLESWRSGFGGFLRKKWLRWYLKTQVANASRITGYNPKDILDGLERSGTSKLSDFLFIPMSRLYHFTEHKSITGKINNLRKKSFARR